MVFIHGIICVHGAIKYPVELKKRLLKLLTATGDRPGVLERSLVRPPVASRQLEPFLEARVLGDHSIARAALLQLKIRAEGLQFAALILQIQLDAPFFFLGRRARAKEREDKKDEDQRPEGHDEDTKKDAQELLPARLFTLQRRVGRRRARL